MDWTFLLIDALPLLAFAVIDSLATTRKAVAAALALAGLAMAYDLYLFGHPDEFSLISLGLIVLFGAWRSNTIIRCILNLSPPSSAPSAPSYC